MIEAEIWYNTISLAAKKCPVALVNGRVKKKEGLNRILYKKLFSQFSLILASNQSTYDFYRSLKLDEQQQKTKVAYSGNLKFASSTKTYLNSIQKKQLLKKLFPIKTGAKLFLAASLQPPTKMLSAFAYQSFSTPNRGIKRIF